jgi:hypothetical protein
VRETLVRHPSTPCEAVDAIDVDAAVTGVGLLTLTYRLTGRTAGLVLPKKAPSYRTDELWRSTCFEAFVRTGGAEGYLEFNLAPSTQWAAYRFDGYRSGMAPAGVAGPNVQARVAADAVVLTAVLGVPVPAPWRVGLSAVVEEVGGRISYWALAHPPGRPDFHHADCFALALPAFPGA